MPCCGGHNNHPGLPGVVGGPAQLRRQARGPEHAPKGCNRRGHAGEGAGGRNRESGAMRQQDDNAGFRQSGGSPAEPRYFSRGPPAYDPCRDAFMGNRSEKRRLLSPSSAPRRRGPGASMHRNRRCYLATLKHNRRLPYYGRFLSRF